MYSPKGFVCSLLQAEVLPALDLNTETFSAPPVWLTALTLLLKVSATVTDYRGHSQTIFFLPGIISLYIKCIGISRNNSLLEGGRAQTEL